MRSIWLPAVFATALMAQPRVDNVLLRMVPPGASSLVGARMDAIKTTDFYRKLVERRQMPQVERFAQETGFDPRRDVRELLFAGSGTGGVLLARGRFNKIGGDLKIVRHGQYNIAKLDKSGFCILDSTLAAAGDLESLEAALDEWTSGTHKAAQPLLATAKEVAPSAMFWGVSVGFAGFLADNMPRIGSGVDFSKIFRGLGDTWFEADVSAGFKAEVHGLTSTEQDAKNLGDTARGLVGFGRLNVPQDHPELLRLWDGIGADAEGRSISIHADIPQDLLDRLVEMLSAVQGGRGRRGTGRAPGLAPFQ